MGVKAEHSLKPDEFLNRTKYISQEYSRKEEKVFVFVRKKRCKI